MHKKHFVTYDELDQLVRKLNTQLDAMFGREVLTVYGVPRGGVPVVLALAGLRPLNIVDNLAGGAIIIDDLIDSGATMKRTEFLGRHFFALIDKRTDPFYKDTWVVFPWEHHVEGSVDDNVRRLIQFVGDDPTRGGLEETPARVAKAWQFWCKGYGQDPKDVLKVFEDGAEGCDEMVVVKDIPFYSKCEHHMADIFGTATIAYVPDGRIVGLSKLNRLLDVFARRLQVQERLTAQVADALMNHLSPKGAGVVIKARHMCMESRGVCQQGHHTVTSALRGVFKTEPTTRAEFLSLANGKS